MLPGPEVIVRSGGSRASVCSSHTRPLTAAFPAALTTPALSRRSLRWPRYASIVRTASIPGKPQARARGLLRCGVAAGPVFVATFLVEGVVRAGYRPLRHPVSSLALGSRGWIQAGNFAVTGTLFLAAAAGLARAGDLAASRRAAPALIGAAGAALIGSAVFTTDPVSGYPPGTPDALTRPSPAGTAHNLMAVPVFFGLPAAALACGWRSWRADQRGFGLYSAGTAVTMLATMALAAAGFGQSPRLVSLGGLFQRASIITGFAWLTALCARALQHAPASGDAIGPRADETAGER